MLKSLRYGKALFLSANILSADKKIISLSRDFTIFNYSKLLLNIEIIVNAIKLAFKRHCNNANNN